MRQTPHLPDNPLPLNGIKDIHHSYQAEMDNQRHRQPLLAIGDRVPNIIDFKATNQV